MKYKIERIKKMISHVVMKLITEKALKDPRVPDFMTITNISLSKDLHYCHIYFTMYSEKDNKDKAVHGLNNASGYIQKMIADNLKLKYTPKVEFRYDTDAERAYEMSDLLNKLSHEREQSEQNEETNKEI